MTVWFFIFCTADLKVTWLFQLHTHWLVFSTCWPLIEMEESSHRWEIISLIIHFSLSLSLTLSRYRSRMEWEPITDDIYQANCCLLSQTKTNRDLCADQHIQANNIAPIYLIRRCMSLYTERNNLPGKSHRYTGGWREGICGEGGHRFSFVTAL